MPYAILATALLILGAFAFNATAPSTCAAARAAYLANPDRDNATVLMIHYRVAHDDRACPTPAR